MPNRDDDDDAEVVDQYEGMSDNDRAYFEAMDEKRDSGEDKLDEYNRQHEFDRNGRDDEDDRHGDNDD